MRDLVQSLVSWHRNGCLDPEVWEQFLRHHLDPALMPAPSELQLQTEDEASVIDLFVPFLMNSLSSVVIVAFDFLVCKQWYHWLKSQPKWQMSSPSLDVLLCSLQLLIWCETHHYYSSTDVLNSSSKIDLCFLCFVTTSTCWEGIAIFSRITSNRQWNNKFQTQ